MPPTIDQMPDQLPTPCWAIHDGAAGNRRQALALAEALELPCREWELDVSGLARWLAPRKFPGMQGAFGPEFSATLGQSPPGLAIGCGRIAALATRQAREAGARAIQILDPRLPTQHWDLVIAPAHDGLAGENVIAMLGSLHPVDANWLRRAREDAPQLGRISGPRTAVLLGGPTRATRFDRSALEVLLSKLEYWLARDGGSVMICGSRRAPAAWAQLLRDRYRDQGHVVWMDSTDGDNPYAAILGWADRIIVSPDSVNMISEACATAVPVYIAEPQRATGRVGKFVQSMLKRGRVRAQEREPVSFEVTPLEETRRVAARVREWLSLD